MPSARTIVVTINTEDLPNVIVADSTIAAYLEGVLRTAMDEAGWFARYQMRRIVIASNDGNETTFGPVYEVHNLPTDEIRRTVQLLNPRDERV